jgi:Cft2 family RNA processing exonuclease
VSSFRLSALGGASEIGANSYLLESGGSRLLLDAGSHPRKAGFDSLPLLSAIPDLDAIFITHGHMDHVGALPVVSRRHPRARILWSRSSETVVMRQLHSAVNVMRKEIEEGVPGAQMIFDHEQVDDLGWKSFPIETGDLRKLSPEGLRVRTFHNGHLLGSVGFLFESAAGRVAYSGDICLHERELQKGLDLPSGKVDTLIVEGTYGASPDYDAALYPDEVDRFAADLNKVFDRGGSVLIPAFALGRTQEMLALVRRLRGQRRIPRIPIFISGLGRAMSEIHDNMRDDAWLKPYRVALVDSAEVFESWMLPDLKDILARPKLFIVTSGMMIENTLSAVLAERLVREEKHAILFVGYVDPSELGHRVLSAKQGDWVEFRRGRPMTQIMTPDIRRYYFSAHADREGICRFCEELDPDHIVLVHGDPPALEWLDEALEKPG